MPFDGNDNTPATNRARLIEALREPMPDWKWDFGYHRCGFSGCAMGLAEKIGLVEYGVTTVMATMLGITHEQAKALFLEERTYGVLGMWNVTPAMVADALERIGE